MRALLWCHGREIGGRGYELLAFWRSRSRFERVLFILFVLTLPFVQPSVFSDGKGYYAYLRSPLIDHNLRFASDWNDPPVKILQECRACPSSAKQYWNNPANSLLFVELNGRIYANPITKTGHLPNFYTVGPAMLWFPFVAVAHLAVLTANHLGSRVPADGHSWPYVDALSGATALYGFLGLYISFQLAKAFVEERWAFLATLGIWFASSLPTTMYLEPSWSHTHSAFCVSLFLWYWYRTRTSRTWKQWLVLGLISGLMIDVYLANGIFLLAPGVDCIDAYLKNWRDPRLLWKNFRLHLLFSASAIVAFSPMLITREIVFGNPFTFGMYANVTWNWRSSRFSSGALLAKGRAFCVHADPSVGRFGIVCPVPRRSEDGMDLPAIGGSVLLPDFGLSLVERNVFVWQPVFHLSHACFRAGAGGCVLVGRGFMGRLAHRSAASGSDYGAAYPLEFWPGVSVVPFPVLS